MATTERMEFPARLKEARDMRWLTQEELSVRAGVLRDSISRFERGAQRPSFENLRRLATTLRVSADYLLCIAENPEPMT